jgi:chemotaxis signal transduction protein
VSLAALPERAQAVRCGPHALALPLGWARLALEGVELSQAPGAPVWLAGAANVEGEIVPVVDLAAWLDPADALDPKRRDTRLLVGGQGEQALGLLFQGFPRLVRVAPLPEGQLAPERLASLVIGVAADDTHILTLDGPLLFEALLDALTQNLGS